MCFPDPQERWGREYEDTLFSKGMRFADEGKVVEDKMLNAIVQQGGFVAAFTGKLVGVFNVQKSQADVVRGDRLCLCPLSSIACCAKVRRERWKRSSLLAHIVGEIRLACCKSAIHVCTVGESRTYLKSRRRLAPHKYQT